MTGIRKTYGAVTALHDVSLTVNEGELFFLLGPSGCGKTTLLRVIAGLAVPEAGTVTFRDRDLLALPIERRNVGIVFQNYALWPHLTVFENVAYGLRMRSVERAEMERRVGEALAMVEMGSLAGRRPAELSGGQQQRVALARALVYAPEIVLLDEPLSNLDAKLRKEMRREIRLLHERLRVTMIYVTHDQEEAASMAERIALMRDGRLVQVGTPQEMYRSPASVYAAEFFGRCNTLRGTVERVDRDVVAVSCETGTLRGMLVAGGPAVATGDPVALVVRPEDFRIDPPGDCPNVLHAVLREREFNGAMETLTAELRSGRRIALLALHGAGAAPAIGDTLTIGASADAVRVIPSREAP